MGPSIKVTNVLPPARSNLIRGIGGLHMRPNDVENDARFGGAKTDSKGAFVHQLIAVHPMGKDQTVGRQNREFAIEMRRRRLLRDEVKDCAEHRWTMTSR